MFLALWFRTRWVLLLHVPPFLGSLPTRSFTRPFVSLPSICTLRYQAILPARLDIRLAAGRSILRDVALALPQNGGTTFDVPIRNPSLIPVRSRSASYSSSARRKGLEPSDICTIHRMLSGRRGECRSGLQRASTVGEERRSGELPFSCIVPVHRSHSVEVRCDGHPRTIIGCKLTAANERRGTADIGSAFWRRGGQSARGEEVGRSGRDFWEHEVYRDVGQWVTIAIRHQLIPSWVLRSACIGLYQW